MITAKDAALQHLPSVTQRHPASPSVSFWRR